MSDRSPHLGPLSIMTHRLGPDVSELEDREKENKRGGGKQQDKNDKNDKNKNCEATDCFCVFVCVSMLVVYHYQGLCYLIHGCI